MWWRWGVPTIAVMGPPCDWWTYQLHTPARRKGGALPSAGFSNCAAPPVSARAAAGRMSAICRATVTSTRATPIAAARGRLGAGRAGSRGGARARAGAWRALPRRTITPSRSAARYAEAPVQPQDHVRPRAPTRARGLGGGG